MCLILRLAFCCFCVCNVLTTAILTKKRSSSLQEFLFGRHDILDVEQDRHGAWHNYRPATHHSRHISSSSAPYNNHYDNNRAPDPAVKPPHLWSPFFKVSSSHLPYDEIAFSVDMGSSKDGYPLFSSIPQQTKQYSGGKRPELIEWPSHNAFKPSKTSHSRFHSSVSYLHPKPVEAKTPQAHQDRSVLSRIPPSDRFICPDRHSCSDDVWITRDTSKSLSWHDRGCFCDALCTQYNDCCRDAPALVEQQEERQQQQLRSSTPSLSKAFQCRGVAPIAGPDETRSSGAGVKFYIQDTCPAHYDSYYGRLNCEHPQHTDPIGSIPATSNVTGVTYKNIFCALCHNDTKEIHVWPVGVLCAGVHSYQLRGPLARGLRISADGAWGVLLRSGHVTPCSMVPRPPSGPVYPRMCLDTAPKCHRGAPRSLVQLCYNHTAVVYSEGAAYKNIYCLLCARPSGSRLSPSCHEPCSRTGLPTVREGLKSRIVFPVNNDSRCGQMEIWDPFMNVCRSLACSRPGEKYFNGECRIPNDPQDEGSELQDENDLMENVRESMTSTVNMDDSIEPTTASTNAISIDSDSELINEEMMSSNLRMGNADNNARMTSRLVVMMSEDVDASPLENSVNDSVMMIEGSGIDI